MTSEIEDLTSEHDPDRNEDTVDPRVQVELERLNAATDDINRLEVDLDEARAGFRALLCESSARLDAMGRKLGSCVEKARPYYEARIKAKEALLETQRAAVRYERANSAHAAAKEMVYLAEEGLCTEGRTFDHAWQEMLNHATMRVNESERERTLSEADHRRTSLNYQHAEIRVQHLQKDLKKSIIKSSMNTFYALLALNHLAAADCEKNLPYFELKAQFNQIFEEQKCKVKELERRVSAAKTSYSEALSNLEQISDEIHRIRQYDSDPHRKRMIRSLGTSAESQVAQSSTISGTATTHSSSTDHWSDSEATGSADSESEEQYLRLPDRLGPAGSPIIPKNLQEDVYLNRSEIVNLSSILRISKSKESSIKGKSSHQSEKILQSQAHNSTAETSFVETAHSNTLASYNSADNYRANNESEEENVIQSLFSRIVPSKLRQNNLERCSPKTKTESSLFVSNPSCHSHTLPSSISDEVIVLTDNNIKADRNPGKEQVETCSEASLTLSNKTSPESDKNLDRSGEIWTEVDLNEASQSTELDDIQVTEEEANSNAARFKIDSSLSNWISRSSVEQNTNGSRRQSFDTLIMGSLATGERVKELWSQGIMKLNISSLTERRSSEPRTDKAQFTTGQSSVLSSTKKVPSPLEKSLFYLNPEDDLTSDSESLASVEMLSDDQISSLMLDQEIQDVCQEVLGTPLGEITALQR